MKRLAYSMLLVVSLLALGGCCGGIEYEPSCGSCNSSSVGWY